MRPRVYGWIWVIVGGLMVLSAVWEGARNIIAAKLVVLGLGALDVAAGILVLRSKRAGRFLLISALTAHLVAAIWLWHNADVLAASIEALPTQPMTHEQMIGRTAGGAMLGMVVWFERGLALASTLLSVWTAVALVRSR